MLEIRIPGFGLVRLEHLVSDFTGTLSVDGQMLRGVREHMNLIARCLQVHVLTADTFGVAQKALAGIDCSLTILTGEDVGIQKELYVMNLGADSVVAIGNGMNDRLMLRTAKVGIAVIEGEGCAFDAISNADVVVRSIHEALGLLVNPKRCVATLRF